MAVLVPSILAELHNPPTGGHLGVAKVLEILLGESAAGCRRVVQNMYCMWCPEIPSEA